GQLCKPDVLGTQVRRMLSDPRAEAFVSNFAGQWLQLRNLRGLTPNSDMFPDFDDNLREAFAREAELFFKSIIDEDRSVLDLMTADYTFVNDRLARHYGIPHIAGGYLRPLPRPRCCEAKGCSRTSSARRRRRRLRISTPHSKTRGPTPLPGRCASRWRAIAAARSAPTATR